MASEESSYTEINQQQEPSQHKANVTPVGVLPPGVVVVMAGLANSDMPHGNLLLAEYTSIGKDPVGFLRSCKKANIHVVISVSKRDPPFMATVNAYLIEKKFKDVTEMDLPRCMHSKVVLEHVAGCDHVMNTAGNAVCGHLDLGCNVLVLSDICQAGRLVVCYSYAWTRCLLDMEDLKEPLRIYVKEIRDKKMLSTAKHYEYLRLYRDTQASYLQMKMEEYKKKNVGPVPNIERLSLEDVVERGPPKENTIIVDPNIEIVADKVRKMAQETGLDNKEIIAKHVRTVHNKFTWID